MDPITLWQRFHGTWIPWRFGGDCTPKSSTDVRWARREYVFLALPFHGKNPSINETPEKKKHVMCQRLAFESKIWKIWSSTQRSTPPKINMGVSKSNGIPKSSTLIGFSIINHPFCGTPIFGNTHMEPQKEPFQKGSSLPTIMFAGLLLVF